MYARRSVARGFAFALLCAASPIPAQDIPETAAEPAAIARLHEATRVAAILANLKAAAPSHEILFRNVRVVDPVGGRHSSPVEVLVRNGRIVAVGRGAARRKTGNPYIIDGRGHFLAPGLVDSHFHTISTAAPLLNLAYGVTSVREMDGFPWMLHWQAHARRRSMLAPYPYVAGTIINGDAMEGYAVVPKSLADARSIVRQQAACGYDFIKVHNLVPLKGFDAIAAEAKAVRLPLVGHVPHDVPVRYAAESGMRTMEHLKGWLNDRNLELGDRDYQVAADFPSLWVVPTLYSTQNSMRGRSALALLDSAEVAYVSAIRRAEWKKLVDETPNSILLARQAQRTKMEVIVRALNNAGARFLAGTDADGYSFTVAGYGLIEELRMLMTAGLSAPQVLRAATSEPAEAFRQQKEFGQIKVGMRADLVLLPRNPLEDPIAYRDNLGVMANGRWLSRSALNSALRSVRSLFAIPADPKKIAPKRLANDVKRLATDGFVFDAASLANAATTLLKVGATGPAREIQSLSDKMNRCPTKS